MKVNFGCGGNFLHGWQNHDMEVDITKTLPYENETVSFIFAEHVVEHVTQHEAYNFLTECHRILKPGGVVRITVPSVVRIDKLYTQGYGDYFRQMGHSDGTKRGSILSILLGHGHQSAWDTNLLKTFMYLAGFETQEAQAMSISNHAELNNVEGHWKAVGTFVTTLESITVEGIK
jgi:predicted SAM-dependent methyltransferase